MYFHSVQLHEDKCRGCTNCIKSCPTEAIRVRSGLAVIDSNRCIDCGQCIKSCPNRAKSAFTDQRDMLKNFKYNVCLPAPAFFGQFRSDIEIGKVLAALKLLGFSHVLEVGYAANAVAKAVGSYISSYEGPFPLISTSCPVVVRLIQVRFPDLISQLIPIEAPMEVAAYLARAQVMKEKDCKDDEIGVFFITPCPAKVTAVHQPVGQGKSRVDGAFSMSEIFTEVFRLLPKVTEMLPVLAGAAGINWARSGGESEAVKLDEYLSVDGIDNVTSVLEEVEMGRLRNLKFVEAQACSGGCVGGVLTVENPFIARVRLGRLSRELADTDFDMSQIPAEELELRQTLSPRPFLELDPDFNKAVKKLGDMEKIVESLPMLDCGACGAPHCRALAEDIVREQAYLSDCVFVMRTKANALAAELMNLTQRVLPMEQKEEKTDES